MTAVYDTIGRTYARRRRADERIARIIRDALGDSTSVLNIGAGTGAYEPHRGDVVAVEPSATMIAQRAENLAPVVRAVAEHLPFARDRFDGVMAILTMHHWRDVHAGLAECLRVARRRIVLLTWDPESEGLWLLRDYFPAMLARDRERFPSLASMGAVLGPLQVIPVPIPSDCTDGFLGAYWRRPAAYLDPAVREGMSAFAHGDVNLQPLEQLDADLASGAWAHRHETMLRADTLDLGYRLVVVHVD